MWRTCWVSWEIFALQKATWLLEIQAKKKQKTISVGLMERALERKMGKGTFFLKLSLLCSPSPKVKMRIEVE